MRQTPKAILALRQVLVVVLLICGATCFGAEAPKQPEGTFAAAGKMTTTRVNHTATLLQNGKVLICGGASSFYSLGAVWASAELYDPVTGKFDATGSMTVPRQLHTATLLPNGKVLITGGTTSANWVGLSVLSSAELYNPDTGKFTSIGNMTTARQMHTAVLLNNGKVLVAGGFVLKEGFLNNPLSSTELFDSETGKFNASGEMIIPRSWPTSALLPSGKVLIAGGSNNEDGPVTQIEIYAPENETFTFQGTAGSLDTFGPAILSALSSGDVLMALAGYGMGRIVGAALYEPTKVTFSPIAGVPPSIGFWGSTRTLLPNGDVLIAGACADGCPVYVLAIAAFSSTGEMRSSRLFHTATLLLDGTVLITGGMAGFRAMDADDSSELYRPATLVRAPVLYSLSGDGIGPGAILHADTHQVVSTGNPALAGEPLEIYGSGLDGRSVIPPQVSVGGRMAELLYFGGAPGYAGLNQVNVRVPSGIAAGSDVPVRLTYLGRPSNEVTMSVRQ